MRLGGGQAGDPAGLGRRGLLAGGLALIAGCTRKAVPASDPSTLHIRGATILSMVPNQPPRTADLLVLGGRIVQIGPTLQAPPDATIIEATGRFVMPGLIDMHAHVTFLPDGGESGGDVYDRRTSEETLRSILAFGITTVRNPAAPPQEGVRLRDDVNRDVIPGPRIFTAGWPLNGGRFDTPERVRAEVDRQCGVGVDFIKVYANSTPELTRAAIQAAHGHGVPVIGHLQATDWVTAARDGIDAVTHAVSWSPSVLPAVVRDAYRQRIRAEGAMKARIFWLESVDVDGPEMDAVIDALASRGIPNDPTLIAYITKFSATSTYGDPANIRLAPAAMRATWTVNDVTGDWSERDFVRMTAAWPKMLAIVKRYHEGGVLLTTGSDLPNRFVVPGLSLIQELQLLYQAGIPVPEVLAMATRHGAKALKQDQEIGTLEVGKRADLIVLGQNPLADIANLRSVVEVIARGRRQTLADLR